jgi:hypothetical protein
MTMIPTLIATTIGAGWVPQPAGKLSFADPASSDPSQSSTALFEGQITMHPECVGFLTSLRILLLTSLRFVFQQHRP